MVKLLIALIIIIALYILAIMPKMLNRPDLSKFTGRYYAHRGLHQDKARVPENSLAAFKLAVEKNYGIELDVHLTRDGEPVVFHDYNLMRVCGLDRKIRDLTFKELRRLSLFDSDQYIPHLQEVLDLVQGRVPLIVEFKIYQEVAEACRIIAPYLDSYQGPYCIESFNPMVVYWYKKNRPKVIRGQLATKDIYKEVDYRKGIMNFVLRNLLFNFITRPDFIAYDQRFSQQFSYRLCKNLYKPLTIAYTIQSKEALKKKYKEFDLFIFDSFIPKEQEII